jgi:hypothetical protein
MQKHDVSSNPKLLFTKTINHRQIAVQFVFSPQECASSCFSTDQTAEL